MISVARVTTSNASRFTPKNPLWYEDLPKRDSGIDFNERLDSPLLDEDLNHVDENYLEISRTSSVFRGLGILVGGLFLLSVIGVFIPLLIKLRDVYFNLIPVLGLIFCVMLVGGIVAASVHATICCQ